jgi:hypothetical protein
MLRDAGWRKESWVGRGDCLRGSTYFPKPTTPRDLPAVLRSAMQAGTVSGETSEVMRALLPARRARWHSRRQGIQPRMTQPSAARQPANGSPQGSVAQQKTRMPSIRVEKDRRKRSQGPERQSGKKMGGRKIFLPFMFLPFASASRPFVSILPSFALKKNTPPACPPCLARLHRCACPHR